VAACERVTKELEKDKVPLIGLVNNAGLAGKVPLEFQAMPALRNMYEVRS
jgi:short-subunit dehydrogenase